MIKSMKMVKLPKRFKYRSPGSGFFVNTIGNRITRRVEKRFRRFQIDGEGKRAHPLSDKRHVVIAGKRDKRWGTHGYIDSSYAKAKLKLHKVPERDGVFTGTMWDSLVLDLKRRKNRLYIRYRFSKTDPKTKYDTGRLTKTGKKSFRSVKNADKARYLMRKGGREGGKVMFEILSINKAELEEARDAVIEEVQRQFNRTTGS